MESQTLIEIKVTPQSVTEANVFIFIYIYNESFKKTLFEATTFSKTFSKTSFKKTFSKTSFKKTFLKTFQNQTTC